MKKSKINVIPNIKTRLSSQLDARLNSGMTMNGGSPELRYHLHKRGICIPAFGLMEMAIVLVIIGIIAGFALKGAQLIDQAKLRTVMNDVEQTRLAALMFQERYHDWPGDFPAADQAFGLSGTNGNGDGQIDGQALTPPSGETAYFWQHLAAGHLLENLKLSHEKGNDTRLFPHCKIGGALTITHTVGENEGPWIVLGGVAKGSIEPGLTPAQAQQLDQSADDGDPSSGQIQSVGKDGQPEGCINHGHYDMTKKEKGCVVLFKL